MRYKRTPLAKLQKIFSLLRRVATGRFLFCSECCSVRIWSLVTISSDHMEGSQKKHPKVELRQTLTLSHKCPHAAADSLQTLPGFSAENILTKKSVVMVYKIVESPENEYLVDVL